MKRLSTLLATAMLALCFSVGQAAAEEPTRAPTRPPASPPRADRTADGERRRLPGRGNEPGVRHPRSQPRLQRRRHAVELDDCRRHRRERQRHEPERRPVPDGRRLWLRLHPGRRPGGQERAGRRRGRDGEADRPDERGVLDPRAQPRSNGDVTQSNSATAGAIAKNDNDTKQDTDQTQAGGGSGSDYTQIAGQAAANHQDADADATAVQLHPSNTAGSIRVLSPGNDGDVTQSNSTTALAAGLNDNETKQSIDQSQGSARGAGEDVGAVREGAGRQEQGLGLHAGRRAGVRPRSRRRTPTRRPCR